MRLACSLTEMLDHRWASLVAALRGMATIFATLATSLAGQPNEHLDPAGSTAGQTAASANLPVEVAANPHVEVAVGEAAVANAAARLSSASPSSSPSGVPHSSPAARRAELAALVVYCTPRNWARGHGKYHSDTACPAFLNMKAAAPVARAEVVVRDKGLRRCRTCYWTPEA